MSTKWTDREDISEPCEWETPKLTRGLLYGIIIEALILVVALLLAFALWAKRSFHSRCQEREDDKPDESQAALADRLGFKHYEGSETWE